MTKKELVSRIENTLKTLNKDQHISRRFIYHTAKNKAKFLLAQKFDEFSLFTMDSIISEIPCFRLKKVKVKDCDILEFRLCNSLMKSVKKVPELLNGRLGNSVLSVTTVDGTKDFTPINPKKYRISKNRMYSNVIKNSFYYIKDGYLYLPDSEVEMVDLEVITLDNDEVSEVSECSEDCVSIWDTQFVCTDKLLEVVIQETLKELLGSYAQIQEDENPNLSVHQKDKTVQ